MKYFPYIIIAIVIIAVVGGFFVVGSPKEERLRQFDDQRVQHLGDIQNQIVNYWQAKNKLPENLAVLEDKVSGVRSPKDPETGVGYEYIILGADKLSFQLCATFARSTIGNDGLTSPPKDTFSRVPSPADSYNWNWSHEAGRFCFDRTIDPDLYKPFPEKTRG